MNKIGNFYLVKDHLHNWTPCRLVKIDEGNYVFQNLIEGATVTTQEGNFREAEIEKAHLDRLGFENNPHKNIHVWRLYFSFLHGVTFTIPFFGYWVFHEDELQTRSESLQTLYNESHVMIGENAKVIHDIQLRKRWDGIYSINELFEKLEGLGITIKNKDEILTGSKK